jgi:serine phosphatase RsbU (regulator of sigma subunit)
MDASDEPFGAERIEEVFRRPGLSTLTAAEMLNVLADEVGRHTGDAPQHDDMTMVVIKAL